MSRSVKFAALGAALLISPALLGAEAYPGIGRPATAGEVKAWDIDVRPDLLGLPPGQGSVTTGKEVFTAKCAACHGMAGESDALYTPLIGGTTLADMDSGQVAALAQSSPFDRRLFMKVATISTLFDYVQRAMPWTQPKTLKADEVYAVTAYLLHLQGVVAADFILTAQNMAEVQQRLPNRNGMLTDHGMWPGAAATEGGIGNGGKWDAQGSSCQQNCAVEGEVKRDMPAMLRKAAGAPTEQNRDYGPVRGQP
ncbi:TPA: cytochrome c [Pseudomonas aeruginosa]|nr:cytochrome c [Pseudomonas aeruginosa]HCA5868831.1 cytochrome c [Pseudomonas aeruginosa]HCA7379608.1 cytochrome c [Pseudomonas aeruginosa]HCA7777469.1 cytochrome c [Pseudomonas aeruginosa]